MQKNNKWRLCDDRDETINHMISEYIKLAQKEYMTGWERWSTGKCARKWNLTKLPDGLCTTWNPSWRMRRIKFLWNFKIQTDRQILARRPDLEIVNKKKKEKKKKKREPELLTEKNMHKRRRYTNENEQDIRQFKLPWRGNPTNTYAQPTETLDSCFDLIRSHKQCIPR